MTDEFALKVLRENPICQKIEQEFTDFENSIFGEGPDVIESGDDDVIDKAGAIYIPEDVDMETGEVKGVNSDTAN